MWRCRKGHEWKVKVYSRSAGNGCPYCYGRYATEDNCLAKLFPKIAREWHPTKNGNLIPNDIKSQSSKKIWWKCKKGHEWLAQISDRARGSGCPYCSGRRKYVPERIMEALLDGV